MNVPIFFYLTDIVILFVGIPQGQSTFSKTNLCHKMYSDPFFNEIKFVGIPQTLTPLATDSSSDSYDIRFHTRFEMHEETEFQGFHLSNDSPI